MEISEISIGFPRSLEIAVDSSMRKSSLPTPGTEVELTQVGGLAMVRFAGSPDFKHVKGLDPKSQRDLEDLVETDIPRVLWVTRAKELKGRSVVAIEGRIFASRNVLPELSIAVDELLIEAISRKAQQQLALAEAADWLSQEFLCPPVGPDRPTRCVILPGRTKESTFLIVGAKWAIRVRKRSDNLWLGDSLVRPPRNPGVPPVLIECPILFSDGSAVVKAASQRGESELDQMVSVAGSYLSIWQEYQEIEWKNLAERAREFGHLQYHGVRRLADGSWQFSLKTTASESQRTVAQRDDINFVASTLLPAYLTNPNAPPRTVEEDNGSPTFSGECRKITDEAIVLFPSNSEETRAPQKGGSIFLDLRGDLTVIKRRQAARERLETGRCSLPLIPWLEGKAVPVRRTAKRPYEPLSSAARKNFGEYGPNPKQIEALQIALNTPDIAVVQGPPGTGKTRTIAALLMRLSEISDKAERNWDRTLLTSFQHDAVENAAAVSAVYGLPAVKIGQRRGGQPVAITLERWRRSVIPIIEEQLADSNHRPLGILFDEVKMQQRAYLDAPGSPAMTADLLKNVLRKVRDYLSAETIDHVHTVIEKLSREGNGNGGRNKDALTIVRGLRVDALSFTDDGQRSAFRVLRHLDGSEWIDDQSRELLERAKEWVDQEPPMFLNELSCLRDRLVDSLRPGAPKVETPVVNIDAISVLDEIVQALEERVRTSPHEGLDLVLEEFLRDIKNDEQGLEETLTRYSVVLAATCQQSVSKRMLGHLEIDDEFETVIVDEAARANPLDLLIPMSRARRRIVLVGDHRQLPHMLEPDVERELDRSLHEETRENLRKSLFQRLFDYAKHLQKSDGIKRWVTLNEQYRMHPVLGDFVSRVFYEPHEEKLESPTGAENYVHPLKGIYTGKQAAWRHIPFREGREDRGSGRSWRRPVEARWIAREALEILQNHPGLSLGVITFYSAQERCILDEMERLGLAERNDEGALEISHAWALTGTEADEPKERLRVGTVDSFQGKEFDVVILSMTRANREGVDDAKALRRKFGHLALENRLCVAMSRQRQLLIVVGDKTMLESEAAGNAVPGLKYFIDLCAGPNGAIF